MTADEAFEISMGSDLTSGPRNNALEHAYGEIRRAAERGLLNTCVRVNAGGTVAGQVVACLKRDGFTVNPGFSSGDIIVGWA